MGVRSTTVDLSHPAIRAWKAACLDGPDPVEKRTIRRRGDSAVYVLRFARGGPASVIVKRKRPKDLLTEQLVYETVLPRLALVTPRYFGSFHEPNGKYQWLVREEVVGEAYSPENDDHRKIAGRWLADLHTQAASIAHEHLPDRSPAFYLGCLRDSRARALSNLENTLLPGGGRQTLRTVVSACDAVEARWQLVQSSCEAWPHTLVHNDLGFRNVRIRPEPAKPTLVVFDWEHAGWGAPAADLAQFVGKAISPAVDAYSRAVRLSWPELSPGEIRRTFRVGSLLRAILRISWDMRALDCGWVESSVASLETSTRRIASGLAGL